jgi:hypothetical protein
MRAVMTLAAVTACAAAIAGGIAVPAGWSSCGGAVRCYARAVFVPAGQYTGGLATVNSSRLTWSGGDSFSTAEMWVCDPQLFAGSDCNTWVEAGLTIGKRTFGTGTSLTWFWAEQDGGGCNNGRYLEDYPRTAALNTSYNDKISFNGSFRYAVYRNGEFLVNTAQCHDIPVSAMMTGLETNSGGNQVTAISTNLQKRASDNVSWSYNWGGSTRENIPSGGPERSSWIVQDASLSYSQN